MARQKRRRGRPSEPRPQPVPESVPPPPEGPAALTVALATLILAVGLVSFHPRMTGDTFMVLKGGQDALEGKLGQPDDWSFMTLGQVWINQNWGTGVLFFAAHSLMGEAGIVVVKVAATTIFALFLVLASRQLGASYSAGMLATAAALLAMRDHIDLRPNLVGMTWMAIVLWALWWSRRRVRRIWLSVLLLTIWAQMHGSFIFGLGMLGLWTICVCGLLVWRKAPAETIRQHWPLPAATLIAVALAALTSPFGVRNLTQPFTLLFGVGGQAWPLPVREMEPVFGGHAQVFGLRQFLLMLGLVTAPLVAWVCFVRPRRKAPARRESRHTAALLFTTCLVILTVCMAFKARRFIPIAMLFATPAVAVEFSWLLASPLLAWPTAVLTPGVLALAACIDELAIVWRDWDTPYGQPPVAVDLRAIWVVESVVVMLAPLLAALLLRGARPLALVRRMPRLAAAAGWLVHERRRAWPTIALTTVVLIGSLATVGRIWQHYQPDHPLYPPQTCFQRMVMYSSFPSGAAAFINDNGISGRVLNDWRWEGFLRWYCPQIKVFIGGRSRQVYPLEAAYEWIRVARQYAGQDLPRLGVHLLVIGARDTALCRRLTMLPDSPWAVVFLDGGSMVLASRDGAETARLIDDALAGRLKYASPAVARLSRTALLMAETVHAPVQEVKAAVAATSLERPEPMIYRLLANTADAKRISTPWVLQFLERELRRLEQVDYHKAQGAQILSGRATAAQLLGSAYRSTRWRQQAQFWQIYARQIQTASVAFRNGWPEAPVMPIPLPRKAR